MVVKPLQGLMSLARWSCFTGSFIPVGVMKSLRASKVFCVVDLICHRRS